MSYEAVKTIAGDPGPLVLATVIDAEGSVPRHPGAKMIVRGQSVLLGTVGGGKGEARAIGLAKDCLETKQSATMSLEFQGTQVDGGQDMICGGWCRMLVEYVADAAPYRAGFERLVRGERVVFVKMLRDMTDDSSGHVDVSVLDENGSPLTGASSHASAAAVSRCLHTGKPLLTREEGVFYDPVFPEEKLLVLGGGYVGQAVAAAAARLDFKVTVGDDREQFATAHRFPPSVDTVCGSFTDIVEGFPFDSATYVVVVTRGHLSDLECVRAVLRRRYRYAGFMGSARKAQLLREQLRADGFEPARIESLYAPIGLEIGAETPEEIAISILGQVVAARRS
jgi:xanthine dehydrogenase accessory factor